MDAPSVLHDSIHQQRRDSINSTVAVLQELSPERTNRQAMLPPPTPSSVLSSPTPSAPGSPQRAYAFQDPFLSSRRGSDVQAKVAQFNNLSTSSSERRQDLEKALQRARLGREQAENENQMLRTKILEYVEREKKVGLRLEESMEDSEKLRSESQRLREKYERAKDALTHSKERFREELRRMKGAEFKADSNQLAAQQALQSERQVIKSLEADLKYSREKSDRFEKESFTTQIKLVELDEQLSKVQQQMKLVEEERNALKTSLKEEEISRIAAEGRIPLPICSTPDEFSSPKKRRESNIPTPRGKRLSKPNLWESVEQDLKKRDEDVANLTRKLEIEVLSRRSAEDLIHFMQLECQLKRCSCRLADDQGVEYIHDHYFQDSIADLQEQYEIACATRQTNVAAIPQVKAVPTQTLIDLDEEIEFSPETGTFRTIKSPQKSALEKILSTPMSEDDSSPNATIVRALGPPFEAESPSLLAPSEINDTLRKLSTDACQILPTIDSYQNPIIPDEQHLATPKAYQARQSDADLLSFTPFVLPSINPQVSVTNIGAIPTQRFVETRQQAPTPVIPPVQFDARLYQISASRDHSHQPRSVSPSETYVRPSSQHSNSYPPPQNKAVSVERELPAQPSSASSYTQHNHNSSYSTDSRQNYTIKTITTTTTIPLAAEPSTPSSKTLPQSVLTNSSSAPAGLAFSPGTTKSREEALACIRSWRKGNAEAAMASKDTNTKLGASGSTNGAHTGNNATNGAGNVNAKPRSRSVALSATPGRRKIVGDRDVSAPVRL